MMRLPILFGLDEFSRLSGIAHTAAIQSGAKGDELDVVMDKILRALIEQANCDEIKSQCRPPLRLVEG